MATENDELKELEQRIRDARARLAKVGERNALEAKRRAAKEAEQEAEDAEVQAKLEDEFGRDRIAVFRTHRGVVAVKRALGVVWSRFTNSKMEERHLEELIRACRIYPTEEEFESIIDEIPGLKVSLGNAIGDLFGVKRRESEGK